MCDKHTKRAKQYLDDLVEEKNDLFKNVEKIISTANLQVHHVSKSQASLSEKEAVLTYLTKILVLFSELNHSVLKCLETVKEPIPVEDISHSTQQEFRNYYKADEINLDVNTTSSNFAKEVPKLSNEQVQDESYIRPPDDTTLKVMCSPLIGNKSMPSNLDGTPQLNNITNTLTNSFEDLNVTNCSIRQNDTGKASNHHDSPTLSLCSESDIFSTISSITCQHPLMKIRPPVEIPEEYNTEEIEKVKENMKLISKKMGFDSQGFAQMTNQFSKPKSCANFDYEEPVRDRENEERIVETENPRSSLMASIKSSTLLSSPEETNEKCTLQKLNNGTQLIHPEKSSDSHSSFETPAPSTSTGAIRKQHLVQEDLIEFSTSASDSESCEKVSTWLKQNNESEKMLERSTDFGISDNPHNAVEKLGKMKRYDRHEEARDKARADMPDLRLIPVEIPSVIKNDLSSNGSPEKANKRTVEPKVKDSNKDAGIYSIREMDVPTVGAVCVFSHIVSPSEFYLQIINDTSSVLLDWVSERLMENLNKPDKEFCTKEEAFVKLGKFCCGSIFGGRQLWYRIQVLDWKLGSTSDEVYIQAVDYGFKETISYRYLRELTAELADIPMLAIKCYFPMLYPPGSTYSKRLTEWPLSTTEALYDIANLSRDPAEEPGDITLFQINFALLLGDSLAVDLVQYSEPDMDTLGHILTVIGLAVEISDDYVDNPELGEFLEDVDQLETADNLNEFILGYDAKDEARICKFTRKDGTCYKGKHCKLEHILIKDGYTTDKTAVFYTAINELILPNTGDLVQVLLTSYVDSCTYLVQIIRDPVKKCGLVMDRQMSHLMDAMNHPTMTSKYVPFKICPAIGEVILVFHPLCKQWFRATVRNLNCSEDNMNMEVYSVDFGEQFTVNIKQTRMMQEEFMHVPFQAITIYLDNYQHKKNCDGKKARKFFVKHMYFKTFLAYIKTNDIPYKVRLTTLKDQELGPTLVKAGFAERRTVDINLTDFDGNTFALE